MDSVPLALLKMVYMVARRLSLVEMHLTPKKLRVFILNWPALTAFSTAVSALFLKKKLIWVFAK